MAYVAPLERSIEQKVKEGLNSLNLDKNRTFEFLLRELLEATREYALLQGYVESSEFKTFAFRSPLYTEKFEEYSAIVLMYVSKIASSFNSPLQALQSLEKHKALIGTFVFKTALQQGIPTTSLKTLEKVLATLEQDAGEEIERRNWRAKKVSEYLDVKEGYKELYARKPFDASAPYDYEY